MVLVEAIRLHRRLLETRARAAQRLPRAKAEAETRQDPPKLRLCLMNLGCPSCLLLATDLQSRRLQSWKRTRQRLSRLYRQTSATAQPEDTNLERRQRQVLKTRWSSTGLAQSQSLYMPLPLPLARSSQMRMSKGRRSKAQSMDLSPTRGVSSKVPRHSLKRAVRRQKQRVWRERKIGQIQPWSATNLVPTPKGRQPPSRKETLLQAMSIRTVRTPRTSLEVNPSETRDDLGPDVNPGTERMCAVSSSKHMPRGCSRTLPLPFPLPLQISVGCIVFFCLVLDVSFSHMYCRELCFRSTRFLPRLASSFSCTPLDSRSTPDIAGFSQSILIF